MSAGYRQVSAAIDASGVGVLGILVCQVNPEGVGGTTQLVNEHADDTEGHGQGNGALGGHAGHDAQGDGNAAGKSGIVGDVAARGGRNAQVNELQSSTDLHSGDHLAGNQTDEHADRRGLEQSTGNGVAKTQAGNPVIDAHANGNTESTHADLLKQ